MKKNKKNEAAQKEVPLSNEELNMLRKSVASEKVDRSKLPHYDNSDKAKFFRYVKKNKFFAAICILLAVCVVVLLVLCAVMVR